MLTITKENKKLIESGEDFVIRPTGLEVHVPYTRPVSKEKGFERLLIPTDDEKSFFKYQLKYENAHILIDYRISWKDFLKVGDYLTFEVTDTTNNYMTDKGLKGRGLMLSVWRGKTKRLEMLVANVVSPVDMPIWDIM